MFPVLILRSEVICLVILLFLFFTSRSYKIDKNDKTFSRLLFFSIFHVLFDIITVLTVNNTDTVPTWINLLCHILFYLSAIFYSNEILSYVVKLCYPKQSKLVYSIGHGLTAAYIACLTFLPISYVEDVGTWSSFGPAAYVGYGLAFVFFLTALAIMLTHIKHIPSSVKYTLIPMMLVLVCTEIAQIIWKSILFTGGAITIVTVGFFFSLENPVEVFKKKAMVDALTGVRSRSSYEEDINNHNNEFQNRPSQDYIYVFCDINSLRDVNNRLGHEEGDNYITLIASSLKRCMVNSNAIYRIGGDEFLVFYYKVNEEVVKTEIDELQKACKEISKGLEYNASLAIGYAKSSSSFSSLMEVVKSADFAMYQNKAQQKNDFSYGNQLNFTGLTDRMFDIFCAANNKSYPFITNLDTNVTRIAPMWKEFFGLDQEFYEDFISIWKERIHPDYFNGYMADIASLLNGHNKYHNYDYYAKKANGEYVKVSCHGSIYRDNSSGTSFFTGFIINYGMEDNIDPITQLPDYTQLEATVCKYQDLRKPFSLLKLKLNNFSHINMMYGYQEGNNVIKAISETTQKLLNNTGKIYCQNSTNFTILFDTVDEEIIKNYYQKITDYCSLGIKTNLGTIPITISGGALINNGENFNIKQLRSGLVFALEESQYTQRNKLVFYREKIDSSDDTEVSLLSKIHSDSLEKMEYFKLKYQPIVDLSKKTIGAEALLRWIHPEYGEILPGKFIGFLEINPCYYQLGLKIIKKAIEDAKKFREIVSNFKININITAVQLQNENFLNDVLDILKTNDYPTNCVVFELTERCKEMNRDFLATKIEELRNTGLNVAFDDLGTGYSTINLLMDIPVDEIKLDRNFVKDISSRENYQLFVKALVLGSTTENNTYTICFEGIENQEMLDTISSYGDFIAQGYYFSKPLLFDDFYNYLNK